MNSITNSGITKLAAALALALVVAVSFAVAPKAQATDMFDYGSADFFGGSSDYGYADYFGGSSDYGYADYFGGTTGIDYGYADYYTTGGSDYGYADYYPTGGSSLGGGGSTMGGSSMGGFSMPRSTMGGGGGSMSQSQGQSQSQSSSNNNVNNNIITISTPVAQTPNPICPAGTQGTYPNCTYPTPVCPVGTTGIYPNCVYPQNPQIDICPNLPGLQTTLPAGYYLQNGFCQFQNYQQPIYPTQPYVTLSQVPYTGLAMGPMETAVYWAFLVLWCLVAAYLIAVKKVHHSLASWFVGSTNAPAHAHSVSHAPVAHAAPEEAPAPVVADDGIDPFIKSQIARFTK